MQTTQVMYITLHCGYIYVYGSTQSMYVCVYVRMYTILYTVQNLCEYCEVSRKCCAVILTQTEATVNSMHK